MIHRISSWDHKSLDFNDVPLFYSISVRTRKWMDGKLKFHSPEVELSSLFV